MNAAQALDRTLLGAGVDVCSANPGTSEMHVVGVTRAGTAEEPADQLRRALEEPGPHLIVATLHGR